MIKFHIWCFDQTEQIRKVWPIKIRTLFLSTELSTTLLLITAEVKGNQLSCTREAHLVDCWWMIIVIISRRFLNRLAYGGKFFLADIKNGASTSPNFLSLYPVFGNGPHGDGSVVAPAHWFVSLLHHMGIILPFLVSRFTADREHTQ